MNVGVIGLGYVGSACVSLFKDYFSLSTYDIVKDCNCDSIEQLTEQSEIIFICLPTPMKEDGSCDLSVINSVLNKINSLDKNRVIVIKSTVEVGTTDKFSSIYNNLDFVFNPEFLTEANFIDDFKNQDRIIIGAKTKNSKNLLKQLYRTIYPSSNKVKIESTSPLNAEFVKYVTNTFLAVKVSFANEIYELTNELNADYQRIIEMSILDQRLGTSHWSVPGPDGNKGFGGSCFPKDINSLINSFNKNNIDSYILKAAWQRNIKLDRPQKDWLKLKGRAVSNENSE